MTQKQRAQNIIGWLVAETGITEVDLKSQKTPYIAYIRFFAIYLVRENTILKTEQIADIFERDLRSVYRALEKIKHIINSTPNGNIEREIRRLKKLYDQQNET